MIIFTCGISLTTSRIIFSDELEFLSKKSIIFCSIIVAHKLVEKSNTRQRVVLVRYSNACIILFFRSWKITSFSTNPFISGQLFKATAFVVMPKMIINALTFCFFIKYKSRHIIMKTEQTTIVCAQWDRWKSYHVIKDHMLKPNVTLK